MLSPAILSIPCTLKASWAFSNILMLSPACTPALLYHPLHSLTILGIHPHSHVVACTPLPSPALSYLHGHSHTFSCCYLHSYTIHCTLRVWGIVWEYGYGVRVNAWEWKGMYWSVFEGMRVWVNAWEWKGIYWSVCEGMRVQLQGKVHEYTWGSDSMRVQLMVWECRWM